MCVAEQDMDRFKDQRLVGQVSSNVVVLERARPHTANSRESRGSAALLCPAHASHSPTSSCCAHAGQLWRCHERHGQPHRCGCLDLRFDEVSSSKSSTRTHPCNSMTTLRVLQLCAVGACKLGLVNMLSCTHLRASAILHQQTSPRPAYSCV